MLLLTMLLVGAGNVWGASYTKVTSQSEIVDGGKYLIVSGNVAMGTQASNNRNVVSVTISNNAISNPNTNAEVVTLETTGTTNQYYLKTKSDGYLYAVNKQNYLKSKATTADDCKFTIILNNGTLTITSTVSPKSGSLTYSQMMYNSGSSCIACYGTTQNALDLYRLDEEVEPSEPVDATWSVSPSSISVAEGGTKTATITTNYDGTLSVSSDDETVATATYSNGTLSVTGVAEGTATLTFSGAATTNYNAINETVEVTVTTLVVTPGEYTVNMNNSLFGVSTGNNGTEQNTTTDDNISITTGCSSSASSKTYYDTGHIRFYAGSYLYVSVPAGYEIKSIVFTADGTWNADGITADCGTYDASEKTWTGSSQEVDFSFTAQDRIATMTVIFAAIDNRTPIATDIALTQTTFSVGDEGELEATATKATGATGDITYTYASSNDAVLTVLEDGTYEATGFGTATITVTATPAAVDATGYKAVSEYINVVVNAAITLSLKTADNQEGYEDIVSYGSPYVLTAVVPDGYDGTITATSGNTAVATFAVSGTSVTLTPVAVGDATITVTAGEGTYFKGAQSKNFTITFDQPVGSTEAPAASTTLFNETFDQCDGTGGRDDTYSGSIGTSATTNKTDETWATLGSNGASKCIKLGSSNSAQTAKTSNISLTGAGTLTFSAAGWGSGTNTLNVTVTGANATGNTSVTLENGTWNDYTINLTGATGSVAVSFSMKRGFLDEVKVVSEGIETVEATIPSSGWGTFCSVYPLDLISASMPTGVKAYVVSAQTDESVTLTEVNEAVKGGTGIILNGTAGTAELKLADSSTAPTNLLVGTLAPTYVAQDAIYGLASGVFQPNNAGTFPANKAYLPNPSGNVKAMTIVFNDADGIQRTETITDAETIYSLTGIRLAQPRKGINIVNGKKVIIK